MSSNLARVKMKRPLVWQPMGNHRIKIHFAINNLRALSLVSATLEICYPMQFVGGNIPVATKTSRP